MPQFVITKSCLCLVQNRALRPFTKVTGQPDGTFVVDVTDEEVETVASRARQGESFSDVIERVLA